MAVKTFAAIVIGSAETEMRIYELSPRKGMKQIDCVTARLNLGAEAYSIGRLDMGKVDELCRILQSYRAIMEGYRVDDYEVISTSVMREIRSMLITRDYIEKQTGMSIRVVSNSEHRFLDYKSIACENDFFEKVIQNGTAIVDIGGSSMQISVFDNDKLITTQNIRLGKISTREQYLEYARNNQHYELILRELLEHELAGFGKLYQKERQINNLIVVDPDLLDLVKRLKEKEMDHPDGAQEEIFHVDAVQLKETCQAVIQMDMEQIMRQYDLSSQSASFVVQSLIFSQCMMEQMGATTLWLLDVSISDGLCYDYGIRNKLITRRHNFEEDIVAASRIISKRYKCNQNHVRLMEELSLEIFSKMKKIHGLGSREKLLLQISAILHNCGKYISLTNVSECAYNIIMATEIIGLSHAERRTIANIVKFNTEEFEYYDEMRREDDVSRSEYLVVAKLTAILRIANALDRSHKQKCKGATASLKDDELLISVASQEDLTLERITLEERADFFEEVFNVKPVLRQKKKF